MDKGRVEWVVDDIEAEPVATGGEERVQPPDARRQSCATAFTLHDRQRRCKLVLVAGRLAGGRRTRDSDKRNARTVEQEAGCLVSVWLLDGQNTLAVGKDLGHVGFGERVGALLEVEDGDDVCAICRGFTGGEESAIGLDGGLSARGRGAQESGGVCVADFSSSRCSFAQLGHVCDEFLLYELHFIVPVVDAREDQAPQGVLAFLGTDQL